MQERFYESGSCVQKNCAILGVHPKEFGPTWAHRSLPALASPGTAEWLPDCLNAEVNAFIYRAFIEGELEVPRHLARVVHDRYFDPQHEEFAPRTMWSLSNAFTSAFKELEVIPQFRAASKLGAFLEGVQAA